MSKCISVCEIMKIKKMGRVMIDLGLIKNIIAII